MIYSSLVDIRENPRPTRKFTDRRSIFSHGLRPVATA